MLNISRESEVNIVNTLIDHDVISGTDLIKIKKTAAFIKKKRSNYLFISAPENVAWLLNIRGHDLSLIHI